MATTIDIENGKTLRQGMTVIVQFRATDLYFGIQNDRIISCKLALRSVSTNADNPELEASTLEVKFSYGDEASNQRFLNAYKGKDCRVLYQAGYDGDMTNQRAFYTSMDEESLTYENGIITVKATDWVGQVAEQNPGTYITGEYRTTVSGNTYRYMGYLINSYIYEIIKPFMPEIAAPRQQKGWNSGTIYEKTPNFIAPNNRQHLFIESKSRRKLVAQFVNLFPGKETADASGAYNLNAKKFIFRDAGWPEAGWCDTAITGLNSSTLHVNTWTLRYEDVYDFKETQGASIKQIKMANPEISYQTGISDPDAAVSGYKHLEDKSVENGKSYVWDLGEPCYAVYISNGTATLIDPQTVAFKATATGIASINIVPVSKTYPASSYGAVGNESVIIPINSEGNKTIEFEPFDGLRTFTYKNNDSTSGSSITTGMGDILAQQYASNERQEWISFKWRGDPRWQPRDILLFIDKDGVEWYCEIDNLTLEHENGGTLSEVTALKRFINE